MLSFHVRFVQTDGWTDRQTDRRTTVKQYAPDLLIRGIKKNLTLYFDKEKRKRQQNITAIVWQGRREEKLQLSPNVTWYTRQHFDRKSYFVQRRTLAQTGWFQYTLKTFFLPALYITRAVNEWDLIPPLALWKKVVFCTDGHTDRQTGWFQNTLPKAFVLQGYKNLIAIILQRRTKEMFWKWKRKKKKI